MQHDGHLHVWEPTHIPALSFGLRNKKANNRQNPSYFDRYGNYTLDSHPEESVSYLQELIMRFSSRADQLEKRKA